MAKKKSSAFNAELLDDLLKDQDPATVLSSDGLLGELKRALRRDHFTGPGLGGHRFGHSPATKSPLPTYAALSAYHPHDRRTETNRP